MGEKNSTMTRVAPVFNYLYNKDNSGEQWLCRMLHLPNLGDVKLKSEIPTPSKIINHRWGNKEVRLHPPRSLLIWLVKNLSEPKRKKALKISPETRKKRNDLIRKDKTVIKEAIDLLSKKEIPKSSWYILEGYTQPDVYIETEDEIIVIEGKRTESHFTENTTWMENRNQMLRHMDCAWNIRGDKNIYGFIIVEGEQKGDKVAAPTVFIEKEKEMIRPKILAMNLPHRSLDERLAISKCFLGITTWQDVCSEFNIEFNDLPDQI